MINRAAIILRYREPAVRWINDADPYGDNPGITRSWVNQERIVYLIPEEDAETPAAVDEWIELNYRQVFMAELQCWYTNPALWPQDLTLRLFREWFDIECHSGVIDTVGGRIYDEPL